MSVLLDLQDASIDTGIVEVHSISLCSKRKRIIKWLLTDEMPGHYAVISECLFDYYLSA